MKKIDSFIEICGKGFEEMKVTHSGEAKTPGRDYIGPYIISE